MTDRHHPACPRAARAIDLAISERLDGPILLRHDGNGWTGTARVAPPRRVGRRAGVDKPIQPLALRRAFITAALDAGVALRDEQETRLTCRAAHHYETRPSLGLAGPA